MKRTILELAINKLKNYSIIDIEEGTNESGAYYGLIVFSDYRNIPYKTGYVFYKPSTLSLTAPLSEIDDRYSNYCKNIYEANNSNNTVS